MRALNDASTATKTAGSSDGYRSSAKLFVVSRAEKRGRAIAVRIARGDFAFSA
jgi:hypothetical protein